MENKELFEKRPVAEAVLTLSLPSVIGQIILVVYNIADTFFVGMAGSDVKITAVTVCLPAFMFLSAIANLYGVGSASVISRRLGKGREKEATLASSFAFWACLATTALYVISAFVFRRGFIHLLGGREEEVAGAAISYLFLTVVLGGIPTALTSFFSHILRAEGRAFSSSFGVMLGGILNVVLDPLFMFVILPPGNEVLGAAVATLLSNVISFLYFVIYIGIHKKEMVVSLRARRDMFSRSIPRKVVLNGLPACLMTLCENISYAVLENMVALTGTAAQAGLGVAKKINMLAHSLARGMSQGVLPLLAYNSRSNKERMKKCFHFSLSLSVGLSILCMVSCLLFPALFVSLFIPEAGVSQTMGEYFLRILAVGAPFSAAAYAVISFFQAVGFPWRSLVLALMRKGGLDIPIMVVVGGSAAVFATPVADALAAVTALILYRRSVDNVG